MQKRCFLFGDHNIHDSLSQAIHVPHFMSKGINCSYELVKVEPDAYKLRVAMVEILSRNCIGFNVTMPHKQFFAEHVDELEEKAKDIGAVSCVVNETGRLKGYNTDLYGFLKAVETRMNEDKERLAGKQVVILGHGGVASAIAYGSYRRGANVIFLGKDKSRARHTAQKFYSMEDKGHYGSLEDLDLLKGDLLVNATPVGIISKKDESLATKEQLKKFSYVFDVISNPAETKMLELAKSVGCKTISGLDMLVYQAARSFELWTGQQPDVELMFKAAREALKNRKQ